MTNEALPAPQKLPNKPLVEAVFEVRWALQDTQVPGVGVDPGYQLLVGSFFERIKTMYPDVVTLPAASAPIEFSGHVVHYQFRRSKDGWPLLQIGPGILTVNDTDSYSWTDFRPRLESSIKDLFDSYPSMGIALTPVWCQLRYINAIPFNPDETTATKLLRNLLHTDVRFDDHLFEDGAEKADAPLGFGMNVTFPLERPQGVGGVIFAQGQHEGRPALVWEILVHSVNEAVPKEPTDFHDWLEAAHELAERWFLTLCRGELHGTFR